MKKKIENSIILSVLLLFLLFCEMRMIQLTCKPIRKHEICGFHSNFTKNF